MRSRTPLGKDVHVPFPPPPNPGSRGPGQLLALTSLILIFVPSAVLGLLPGLQRCGENH